MSTKMIEVRTRRGIKFFVLSAIAAFSVGNTSGAEMTRQGDALQITGRIGSADVSALRHVLTLGTGGQIRTIVFEQCLGGTIGPSLSVADIIEGRRLTTVARGQCSSGCALAYMAGAKRTVDTARGPAAIIFHNGTHRDGSRIGNLDLVMDRLDRYSSHKLTHPLRELIRGAKSDSGAVFFFPAKGSELRAAVGFCAGTLSDLSKCRIYPTKSARKLGITTER